MARRLGRDQSSLPERSSRRRQWSSPDRCGWALQESFGANWMTRIRKRFCGMRETIWVTNRSIWRRGKYRARSAETGPSMAAGYQPRTKQRPGGPTDNSRAFKGRGGGMDGIPSRWGRLKLPERVADHFNRAYGTSSKGAVYPPH